MADFDVIISGGGPVGLGLAIDLTQRGISVLVVEKYQTLQPIPKGQNMTQRTGEHFRAWGVSNEIRAAAPIPHGYSNSGANAFGTLLGPYSYEWLKRGSVDPYYAAETERMPQYVTEQVLRDRATALGIEVLYDWMVHDATQSPDGVTVRLHQTRGADMRDVAGRYLVGCDGAGSTVRELAGIRQTVDSRGRRMVLTVFQSPELDTLIEPRFGEKSFFNVINPALEGYWQFLGRVDMEARWFFHMPVRDDETTDSVDIPKLIAAVVGQPIDLKIDYVGFWDLRFAQANTYRNGRILIAGDAAHAHPPYGGYGVNSGFEDARNLAWKLAAQLQGWGSEALLDTYSAERHPVFASTRDNFIAKMIEDDAQFVAAYHPDRDLNAFEQAWADRSKPRHEVMRFLPNYAGSPIVVGEGVPGATGNHVFKAQAGYHLAPALLADGSKAYDQLSDSFTLILVEPDGADIQAAQSAIEAVGAPIKLLAVEQSETVNRWEARAILVRPDHFVAAALDSCSVAEDILAKATGRKVMENA